MSDPKMFLIEKLRHTLREGQQTQRPRPMASTLEVLPRTLGGARHGVHREGPPAMIILGIILLLIGLIAEIAILTTLGIILVVVGAVLALLGRSGRKVGSRNHYY